MCINKILNYIILKISIIHIKGTKIKSINCSKNIKVGKYVQIPKKVFIRENVKIGKYTYLSPNTVIESNVEIGNYCSLAPHVHIGPGEHYMNYVTTHPILFDPVWRKKVNLVEKQHYVRTIKKTELKTIIGNDVWIGLNVIILRGVKVGNGAVIGAGSIVTKDIPDYAVVAGNPAKIIKYRFNKDIIKKLTDSCWWEDDINNIENMYNYKKFLGEKNENKKIFE